MVGSRIPTAPQPGTGGSVRWLIGLVVPAVAFTSSVARAECTRAYTDQELASDLGTLTAALRNKDDSAIRASGKRLDDGLPCLRSAVPRQVLTTAYRYVGLYHYKFGAKERAQGFWRTGLELNDTFEWDIAEVPVGDPLRADFETARADASADPVPVEGKDLNVPAGSRIVVDGSTLEAAALTTGRPHLLQVVAESDNSVRQVMVIEGNALPDRFLIDAVVADAGADDGKKKKKGEFVPTDDLSVQKVKRVRPKAKTPLMIAGAAVALGAGGIYGASFATKGQFESATTTADLERYQTLTNTLVIASGATLVAGLSIEYAGILLGSAPGGGGMVGWRGRF